MPTMLGSPGPLGKRHLLPVVTGVLGHEHPRRGGRCPGTYLPAVLKELALDGAPALTVRVWNTSPAWGNVPVPLLEAMPGGLHRKLANLESNAAHAAKGLAGNGPIRPMHSTAAARIAEAFAPWGCGLDGRPMWRPGSSAPRPTTGEFKRWALGANARGGRSKSEDRLVARALIAAVAYDLLYQSYERVAGLLGMSTTTERW